MPLPVIASWCNIQMPRNKGYHISRFLLVYRILLLSLSLLFLLSACSQFGSDSESTPTPFPVQIPVQRITTAAPIPISLENLAANPDFYIGATLQLSGQFHRLPRLVCQGESYYSPASWALEENSFLANASGMDAQLRSLVSEGQEIEVEGRWLKFEGPVGCEGNVQDETIWYLSLDRVLDPYPLVRLQATPASETAVLEDTNPVPESTAELVGQGLSTETPPPASTATAEPSLTPALAEASSNLTATITPIPSATIATDSMTPTVSANQTPSGDSNGTPTATADGSDATATGTVTVTPAASVTPSNLTVREKGSLSAEDLVISSLDAAHIDAWTLNLVAGDAITITVAPAASTDIVLSLFDSNNVALVSDQNNSQAGMPETITNVSISSPGIHTVQIKTSNETQTDYALMFMDSDSYSYIFKGQLAVGSAKSGNVAADTDHFWFFNANSGDSVSFIITPNDNSDPYIELYNPDGERILTIDDNNEEEAESLENYTLLDGGMYGIRVAEFDFQPMAYSIELLP